MIPAVLTLLLGIILVLAIIAANGFFVAQEFAYMSVDRSRLGARAEAGDVAAKRALKVTRRTSFMLSGAQLGITVTGLMVGYIAEPLIGESVGVLLGGIDIPAAVSVSVGTVLALVLATVVQMVFGELYPKNLAIAAPEPLARGLARSTLIYLTVFGWLIAVFDFLANVLLRLLRVEPVHDVDTSASAEDLKRAVAESRESGDLPAELSILIDRVLDFPEEDAEHAMIPRSRVATVSNETTIGRLRELMAHAHSRYPVIDGDGEPIGIVQIVDLLRTTGSDDDSVLRIMREPLVVPALMALPNVLEEMILARTQLACVVDEYGGFAGILTTEDLAEELVGEITDEHDDEPPAGIVVESQNVWRIDGDVPLDEVERAVGYGLPEGDFETFAGLTIFHEGGFPELGAVVRIPLPGVPGDIVETEKRLRMLDVEVQAVAKRIPQRLRAVLVELDAAASDGEGATE